ncbi:MAG: RNA polymerase sigma factor [Polyangiaceae bacterium]
MAGLPRAPHPHPVRGDALSEETASLRLVVRSVIANVMGLGASHPDVEDCAHEALSRALEGKDRLRPGEPLRPWVIGIARHVAIDALRRNKRTRMRAAHEGREEDGEGSALDRVADPAPGPEERASTNERATRIQRVLAELPEDHRKALVLFHVDGLKYQAIAAQLGVPMGTVATWIARGRKTIAESLGVDREVTS